MKSISWLDKFAEERKSSKSSTQSTPSTKKNVRTASKAKKRITAAQIKLAKKLIIKKSLLPKAVVGNKVKYRGFMWKVINASYKDKNGTGIVLKKIAAISDKKITDPEERAYTDPGNIYDYEVRDSYEVPEMQDTAANTERRISQENAVDRTTPAGRATNPYKAFEENENIFEELMDEDFSEEDVPAEHDMTEEVSEETPSEEENVALESDKDFEKELLDEDEKVEQQQKKEEASTKQEDMQEDVQMEKAAKLARIRQQIRRKAKASRQSTRTPKRTIRKIKKQATSKRANPIISAITNEPATSKFTRKPKQNISRSRVANSTKRPMAKKTTPKRANPILSQIMK